MPCTCYDDYKIRKGMAKAGIPEKYHGKTLAGYMPETDDEFSAVAAIKYWLDTFPKPKDFDGARGLILSGSKGNGKTHLLCAIGKSLIKKGVEPVFRQSADALEKEKGDFGSERELLSNAPVVLLDDLGAEHAKEWGVSFLNAVLDKRYASDRVTVITTNFTRGEILKTYGERFDDRLFEMCQHLRLDGPSRRNAA